MLITVLALRLHTGALRRAGSRGPLLWLSLLLINSQHLLCAANLPPTWQTSALNASDRLCHLVLKGHWWFVSSQSYRLSLVFLGPSPVSHETLCWCCVAATAQRSTFSYCTSSRLTHLLHEGKMASILVIVHENGALEKKRQDATCFKCILNLRGIGVGCQWFSHVH